MAAEVLVDVAAEVLVGVAAEVFVVVAADVFVGVALEVLVGVVAEVFVCTGITVVGAVVVLTVFTSCKARPAAITYKLQVKLSYFGFPLEVIS